jgi:ornithine decarboxylase
MDIYRCAADIVRLQGPERPVLTLRPHAAGRAARWFLENFPGKTLYAVKANSAPRIVSALYEAGIRDFDVASIPEIQQVSTLVSGTCIHVMHPVKSRELVRTAYFDFGVRTFALDCEAELEKILAETGHARDLTLVVRIACPSTHSEVPLEGKFGISWLEATSLLQKARQAADTLGLSFHVGSQAMLPTAYGQAMQSISHHIVRAGVVVDVVDVGGGFPSCYPGLQPPTLRSYMDEITAAFEQVIVGQHCELWAEPGRALVAESESIIVRVDARKGDTLYINDGAFGVLFDAAHLKFLFPARKLERDDENSADLAPFSFYGPTCDSIDYMPGPFHLPEDIGEGDYLEIGNIGAYGRVMASQFNGFGYYNEAIVTDEPIFSMYADGSDRVEVAASR